MQFVWRRNICPCYWVEPLKFHLNLVFVWHRNIRQCYWTEPLKFHLNITFVWRRNIRQCYWVEPLKFHLNLVFVDTTHEYSPVLLNWTAQISSQYNVCLTQEYSPVLLSWTVQISSAFSVCGHHSRIFTCVTELDRSNSPMTVECFYCSQWTELNSTYNVQLATYPQDRSHFYLDIYSHWLGKETWLSTFPQKRKKKLGVKFIF